VPGLWLICLNCLNCLIRCATIICRGTPWRALRWSSVDSRPKRQYTVSEKVRAAYRHNLAKANAVPKDFRYRDTVRRQQASRENLKKALAARKAASPPPATAPSSGSGCGDLVSIPGRPWPQARPN
jgi:hypothetical protein